MKILWKTACVSNSIVLCIVFLCSVCIAYSVCVYLFICLYVVLAVEFAMCMQNFFDVDAVYSLFIFDLKKKKNKEFHMHDTAISAFRFNSIRTYYSFCKCTLFTTKPVCSRCGTYLFKMIYRYHFHPLFLYITSSHRTSSSVEFANDCRLCYCHRCRCCCCCLQQQTNEHQHEWRKNPFSKAFTTI